MTDDAAPEKKSWNFIAVLGQVKSTVDTLAGMGLEAKIHVKTRDGSNELKMSTKGFREES